MSMRELPLKVQKEMKLYFEKNGTSESRKKDIVEKARALYKEMLYDSQEPMGVVAAQSLSEPCTQMSLDYNEKVIVKRGGVIRIIPIGMLVDKAIESRCARHPDGWEVFDAASEGICVPGITHDEMISWNPVAAFSRHKAPESMLEIRTMSGRKIVATDSHSFVVRKHNAIVPISGNELVAGDRIPSLLYLPENCVHKLETTPILSGQKFAKKYGIE
jgi:DNA-directed RNA polymerase subunit A"